MYRGSTVITFPYRTNHPPFNLNCYLYPYKHRAHSPKLRLPLVYKSSFRLLKTSLHCLYYSLVYPFLIYCISVWGSTYQRNLSRVVILQKKIIRIISKLSFDSHTDVLFKEQEILKFSDSYLYQIGKFMYLFKRGLLPNYFRDMFTLASQLYSHYTRNCNLFYIPPSRINIRNFSIRFQGHMFFNSLSREIQNSESILLFSKRLKKIPSFLVKYTLC